MDLGQIFTSKVVAEYMVSLFGLNKNDRILEPCFGAGAFLEACKTKGYTNVYGCEIDKGLFRTVKKSFPSYKLICGDFLSFCSTEKYEGIIMNPPYVRQEKIDDMECLGITKEGLRRNVIYEGLPSTANLYMYFLIKAIDLLDDQGELIVIFPSSWMQAKSGEGFKKLLYKNATLVKEIHINGDVFEKNALVDVVILKFVKGKMKFELPVPLFFELQGDKLIEKERRIDGLVLDLDIPFAKYSSVRRGLTTGWNTMFINPSIAHGRNVKYIRKIISTPKAVNGYNTNTALTDDLLVIHEGDSLPDELMRYIDSFETLLEKEKKPKTLYERVKQTREWYTLNSIDSNGILFSYFVRNDMKFVMNTIDAIARDNFYIIYPEIDKYLMFALLNNYYTYYQLEMIGKKYGAGLLKLQRYDIENLRFIDVKRLSKEDSSMLIGLAKELVNNSKSENIETITNILSKYVGTETASIVRAYEELKKKRLEAS